MQMKRPLIFINSPNALKNWLTACGSDAKILYDLETLSQEFSYSDVILLIHLSSNMNPEKISLLCQQGFDVLAFSDRPSTTEGIELFKKGIKGYLNTHATADRIQQALTTINSGSIWLGSEIMQAMIGQVGQSPIKSSDWKKELTPREIQVVEQVLNKKSNQEIAETLSITERTVKSHLHNVFEKLQVSDRLALALKIHNW